MSDYQTLSFEQSGPIAQIVLNRPDAANGMNDAMTRELAVVAALCDVPEVKAVVLTGAGRFFCAGGDLKAMAASPGARSSPGRRQLGEALGRLLLLAQHRIGAHELHPAREILARVELACGVDERLQFVVQV